MNLYLIYFLLHNFYIFSFAVFQKKSSFRNFIPNFFLLADFLPFYHLMLIFKTYYGNRTFSVLIFYLRMQVL